jgi:SNF family Na+-dependent transporter
MDGLKFLFVFDFDILFDPSTWIQAGVQAFFQLGIGYGVFINFASRCEPSKDLYWPSVLIHLGNIVASLMSSLVAFPVLGYLSQTSGIPVEELQMNGVALAFET